MRYPDFKRIALCNRCRECINQLYGTELETADCQYWIYPETCSDCGRVRNIVTAIVPLSRWKIWRAKDKTTRKAKENEI